MRTMRLVRDEHRWIERRSIRRCTCVQLDTHFRVGLGLGENDLGSGSKMDIHRLRRSPWYGAKRILGGFVVDL
jgi:hypothetical protein